MPFKQSFAQGLTEASSVAKEKIGTIRNEGEKIYKYVQYKTGTGGIAGTAGRIVGYHNNGTGYALGTVTADVSDCSAGIMAGQLMATLTDLQYGWIQIRGRSDLLNVDAVAGTLGNAMKLSATTDGTVTVVAAVTEPTYAIFSVTTASAQRLLLNCPI